LGDSDAETGAGRLLERLSYGDLFRWLGGLILVLSLVALWPPVAGTLFSVEGGSLPAYVAPFFEGARLVLGLTGLLLLAGGCLSGRLRSRASPVRWGDVVLMVAAAAIGLVAVEVALRVRGAGLWGSAFRTPLPLQALRPQTYLVPRPGVYVRKARSEYDPSFGPLTFYTINRYGLRGKLPELPKPPGARRIVCLGGSTTFGWTVGDGEDWPSQVARLLGDPVDVVNAGRPGATTFRNFSYLRDRLLQLEPDVVIFYEGYNDMWRGYRRHAGDQPDYGTVDEEIPSAPEALAQRAVHWPRRPSFLAYHVGKRIDGWLFPPYAPPPGPAPSPEPFVFDPTIVSVYEHNLAAMVRLCRRNGASPVLLTFAACADSSLAEAEQRRRLGLVFREMPALDPDAAHAAMDLYRKATRKVAQAEDAPLVDMAALMPKDLGAYTDTVHFTPAGARRFAEILVRGLRDAGLVPPS
jgi:lysophospholipase L1-like esterase